MEIVRRDHPDIYAGGPNYSRSVRAGNLLFISGCTANRSAAKGGPPIEQLRVILDRITRIVAAEGGAPSDILKLTTFVADKADWFPMERAQIEVYEEFFAGKYPANTIVEAGIGAEGLVSRAERKRTSGAEQNRTTERHVVKHQGPGGVRARFRQLPEVGWTSCCA